MFLAIIFTTLLWENWSVEEIPKNYVPLKGSLLSGEFELRVSDIKLLGSDGLVIFSSPDKTIQFFNLKTKKLKMVARPGQGPGEFDRGFISGTVIGNRIYAYDIGRETHVSFTVKNNHFKPVLKAYWETRSHVKVGGEFIVGVVGNPGYKSEDLEEYNHPKASLALYQIQDDGKWVLHGPFHDLDIMDHGKGDFFYSQKTELLKAPGEGEFYRIPKWNSPTFQVMNYQGEVVRELPIPHPHAHILPKSPGGKLLRYQTGKNKLTLDSVCVDSGGILHMNLQKLYFEGQDLSKEVVVKIDPYGEVLGVYRLDRKIHFLTVSGDGETYYGLDQETNGLVMFTQ